MNLRFSRGSFRSTNSRGPQRGQVLVVFAGGLIALVLFTGLVIDGGNVFLQRRDAQNSSDLGALGGAKRLADYYVLPATSPGKAFSPTNNVFTAIQTRMTENGCPTGAGSDCVWTARYVGPRVGAVFQDLGPVSSTDAAPPGATSGTKALGVNVLVTRNPRTYLLGVIGQSTWRVDTAATAMTGKLEGAPAGQLLPIAMTEMPTQEGTLYSLTNGADGPGNFGWLSWDGSNDPGTLAADICSPANPSFDLPAQFPGDPGKSNSKDVRGCLQQWVDSGQPVLIPIVLKTNDPLATSSCYTGAEQGGGNNFYYCIVAIAAFVLTGYDQPAVDQITGRFLGTIPYSIGGITSVPGGVTAPPDEGAKLYLLGLAQ